MRIACFVLAAVLPAGCVWELDQEHPERTPLGEVVGDCVVPLPEGLSAWGAPVSLEFPDRSLWVWSEVTTASGEGLRNVGAFVSSAAGACRGELSFVSDGSGVPMPLVALTEEEEAESAARTDGRRAQLTIGGGFVHEGRALAYYEKALAGPGIFDAETVGWGVCRMAAAGGPCERATPGMGIQVAFF